MEGESCTHLSHTLHGAPNAVGGVLEAVQIPAGDLGHNVIQAGLKAGRGFPCHHVLDFWQGNPQGNFGSNEC